MYTYTKNFEEKKTQNKHDVKNYNLTFLAPLN